MSKLDMISQALESKQAQGEIVLINTDVQTHLPAQVFGNPKRVCGQSIEYRVAPARGLYAADELNEFMLGLVPDLVYSDRRDFAIKLGNLVFGHMVYKEVIGHEDVSRVLSLADEEAIKAAGLEAGHVTLETHASIEYFRRIIIKPYPDKAIGRDAFCNEMAYSQPVLEYSLEAMERSQSQ